MNVNTLQGLSLFVSNNTDTANPRCRSTIAGPDSNLFFNLTFAEAKDCGWAWKTSGDRLFFESVLRASDNVNSVSFFGMLIEIGPAPADIPLRCSYYRNVTVETDISPQPTQPTPSKVRYLLNTQGGFYDTLAGRIVLYVTYVYAREHMI